MHARVQDRGTWGEKKCCSEDKSIHFANKSTYATGRCRCTVRGNGEAGRYSAELSRDGFPA